jgi:hypothetical protein
MTSLRWDNVPKHRVERPPLLAPGAKAGRPKQKPPSLQDRIEEVGGTRPERQELSRSASAADYANSANRGCGRCSACKAHRVTLWRVQGLLVCATCRTANQEADTLQSGHRQEQDLPKATRTKGTVTAVIARRDITWAAGQGASDRNAGTVCPKYKNFLRTYKLPRSPSTLRMWNAYRLAGQSTPQNTARPGSRRSPLIPPDAQQRQTPAAVARKDRKRSGRARPNMATPRPKQKTCWTRGLTLYDAPTARRKTVRRYDLVEPRWSDLSPENAALLMQVNQQNTLVDMWR